MRRAGIALAVTLVILLLFFAVRPLVRPPVNAVSEGILSTVGSTLRNAGLRVRGLFANDAVDLRERVHALEEERNRLLTENAALRDLRTENERLRGLLGFTKRTDATVRPATVIGGSDEPDVHTLTIDAGKAHGVLEGDVVVSGDGAVVGKVIAARNGSSIVELLTDARSRFASSVMTSDGPQIVGVAEGGHGTGLILRLIPEGAAIAPGDPVVTSGLEPGIPRGLVIGTIESIAKGPNVPFQTATLSPLAPLDALSVVAVVLSPR